MTVETIREKQIPKVPTILENASLLVATAVEYSNPNSQLSEHLASFAQGIADEWVILAPIVKNAQTSLCEGTITAKHPSVSETTQLVHARDNGFDHEYWLTQTLPDGTINQIAIETFDEGKLRKLKVSSHRGGSPLGFTENFSAEIDLRFGHILCSDIEGKTSLAHFEPIK